MSSNYGGFLLETEDDKGFDLNESTEVDNPIPELPSAGELCAWWSFGHQMSLAVFGRLESPEVMHAWLEAQGLSSLVSCDVPRPACFSLDKEPCSVDSSGDCRGPLGVARLFIRRSIL
jgi:hypothetical protein